MTTRPPGTVVGDDGLAYNDIPAAVVGRVEELATERNEAFDDFSEVSCELLDMTTDRDEWKGRCEKYAEAKRADDGGSIAAERVWEAEEAIEAACPAPDDPNQLTLIEESDNG